MWWVTKLLRSFISVFSPPIVYLVLGVFLFRLFTLWIRFLGRVYHIETSPDTFFLYGGFGVGVVVALLVVFYSADGVTRIRLLYSFVFITLFTFGLALLGSAYLWWVDPFVHERVVWVFGEVKIVKHFWPDAQLIDIGESILRSHGATHLPVSLLAIAADSNHDADVFRSLLEQEMVVKQALVQSWWWWIQNTLGVVGLTPGHATLSVGFQVLYYGVVACVFCVFSYTLHQLLFAKMVEGAVAVEVAGSSVVAVPSVTGASVVSAPLRHPQAVLDNLVSVSLNHTAVLRYLMSQMALLQAQFNSKFASPSYVPYHRLYPQVTTSSVIPFSGTGQAVGGGLDIGPHISRLLLENMG